MEFKDLQLSEPILRALTDKGYTTPTPIQAKAIPVILEGRDLFAAAQTGTGKTAGFTLPLLQKLTTLKPLGGRRQVRALILTPTRELAAQVAESVNTYGVHLPFKTAVVFGGVGINPQISLLRSGVDILVATPGRLLDLLNQKACTLDFVEFFILDEADRMLDMGFIHDIRKVMRYLPQKRQNLLFSATFSKEIRELAAGFLNNPASVDVAPPNATSDRVAQSIYRAEKHEKPALLAHLIEKGEWNQVLVFTRTKHGANRLAERLSKGGINSAAIHGNKGQSARTRALADFKSLDVRVLVATDIAARGIDISQLPHVVNFELPNVPEDYVHRIGRTGRAGSEGEAISLVAGDEVSYLRDIERLTRQKIPVNETPSGFSAPPKPSQPDPDDRDDEAPGGRFVRRGPRPGAGGGRGGSGPSRGPQGRSSGGSSGGSSSSSSSRGPQGHPRPRH